jgi:hypothetical protein
MWDSFSVDISKSWQRDEGHSPTQQSHEELFGNRRERIDADQLANGRLLQQYFLRRLIEIKRF